MTDEPRWYMLVELATGRGVSAGTEQDEPDAERFAYVPLPHRPDFSHERWDPDALELVPREPPADA